MITRRILLVWSIASLLSLFSTNPIYASMENASVTNASTAPCSDCHLCTQPTVSDPCLKECFRAGHASTPTKYTGPKPDLIKLGQSGGLYEPVSFDHQSHADMGSMGDGCSNCHHSSPTGHIAPCSECHLQPASLGQPGLKGAYHRQCLGCHKQWSGSTECANCHIPDETATTVLTTISPEASRLIPISAHKPDKKVYDYADQNGEKITFYHNDHVEKFGVECVTCHQGESCGYCHDPNGSSVPRKSAEEIHSICSDCHDGDNCKLCHGKQEKSPFTHDASHWRLGEYHRHLPCRSCHEVGQRIKSLRADCADCHADWGPDNFEHQLGGLKLDETHREFDCTDCHSNSKYHQPTTCIDCHDEERTARETPPGVLINGMFNNNTNSKEVP